MQPVLVAPPDRADGVGFFKRIAAFSPRARSAAAVARPAGPAPMMMAPHELAIARPFPNAKTISREPEGYPQRLRSHFAGAVQA
jgi:hypothetical protein